MPLRLHFDISKINDPDEDIPNNSELEGDENDEEENDKDYWVKGQHRIEHEHCGGIGCLWCDYRGYTIKKS